MIMEQAIKRKSVYVVIDTSIFDPVFALASVLEDPCGMTPRELLYIVKRLNLVRRFKILEMCGKDPRKNLENRTIKLCAKIMSKVT